MAERPGKSDWIYCGQQGIILVLTATHTHTHSHSHTHTRTHIHALTNHIHVHTCTLVVKVINCYMKLLMEAYGRQNKVYIVSTFFYTKLARSGYSGVERWIRKVDLKRLRLLLVPVHLSMSHWSLAAVNFRAKVYTMYMTT